MKPPAMRWRCVALVLAALLAAGALFVTAGLAPIAADAGHWPVTRALLEFAMTRSVERHAISLRAPPLDDPALALKGAGHYATGCLQCHGAPGVPRAALVRRMLPQPPLLPGKLQGKSPEELFWIVKHGIKYTAMPAWVAPGRDDEVWAMVAFLERFPELTPAQFRQMAYGELAEQGGNGRADALAPLQRSSVLDDCTRCHGSAGTGRGNAAFPGLAGQGEAYLLASLEAFARGERHSGIMQPIAEALDARELRALARHFSSLAPAGLEGAAPADAAARARGERLAMHGDGARRIPACAACHGPGKAARNPLYPELSGQYAGYLALQMRLFRDGGRGGTRYAPVMQRAVADLAERDIRDLALYYATLPAGNR